ncbi:hypothetical protein EQ826_00050 [Ectopseudomonas mendocina]|nr:hypothetical protein [Pseudomonas mendocina]TRO29319.1 hypothetical protein EQ826_00050 [Pseudomonas mendocina]
MSDLKILYPEPVVVVIAGRKVRIKPVKFGLFEDFAQASTKIMEMLAGGGAAHIFAWAAESSSLEIVLAGCTSLPRWRVRRLPAQVAVQLMLKVMEVNNDFFGQALARAAKL